MNIVLESEGGLRPGGLTFPRAQPGPAEKEIKKEANPLMGVKEEPTEEVEPPDEIISSPASKLNIFSNNKNYLETDTVKVKLLEEYNQLSPAVSPPPQTSSVSPPNSNKNKIITRKIKETFILNPFKGKADFQDNFKKLDSTTKLGLPSINKTKPDIKIEGQDGFSPVKLERQTGDQTEPNVTDEQKVESSPE